MSEPLLNVYKQDGARLTQAADLQLLAATTPENGESSPAAAEVLAGLAMADELDDRAEVGTADDSDDGTDAVESSAEMMHGQDSTRVYLKTIGKVALLDAEQEVELAKRIEAGQYATKKRAAIEAKRKDPAADVAGMVAKDQQLFADKVTEKLGSTAYLRDLKALERDGAAAKKQLLEANLRLSVSIAKRYVRDSGKLTLLDLAQEGNIGLIRAVEKFDYTKGYKFSTYATWWIRQAITRAIADQARAIRIPIHMLDHVNKMERIWREQHIVLGREPEPEDLAREMGVGVDRIVELQGYARLDNYVSLDQPMVDDQETPLGDFIEDTDAVDPLAAAVLSKQADDIRAVLDTLNARERETVIQYYGLDGQGGRTHREIAERFGLTRQRVSMIYRDAMEKLGRPGRADHLRGYLDED